MSTSYQVKYAMLLLQQCGYSTAGLRSEHLALARAAGFKADWPGSVEVWVETMTTEQVGLLIGYLESLPQRQTA
jgi:hypothetical protein